MNIAVITGASSGIGEQFLRQIVKERGYFGSVPFDEIWVIARRAERLLTLQGELDPVRIRVFQKDLTSAESLDAIRDELTLRKPTIGLLVNCAGFGRNGRVETVSRSDVHDMIALNCSSLAELTTICLPYMIPSGDLCTYATGPRIINIASSAGFLPQPGFDVYAATKSFVIHYSRALHSELRVHNIASTTVCPGPVATEFIGIAAGKPGARTKGFKSLFVVKPERLVRKSIKAAKSGRGLYVYGFSQKCLHVFSKILPVKFLMFLITCVSKDARAPAKVSPDSKYTAFADGTGSTGAEAPAAPKSPAPAVPPIAAGAVPSHAGAADAPSRIILPASSAPSSEPLPALSADAARILALYSGTQN